MGNTATSSRADRYWADPNACGADHRSIQTAHTLDLVIALIGGFESLSAQLTRQYPTIEIGDGAPQPRTTFDHVLLQGRLTGGGAVSAEVIGGRPPGAEFELEVTGTECTLALRGGAARGFQSGRLRLFVNGEEEEVDAARDVADGATNVAADYATLRDDVERGTRIAAGFAHAVRLARLIDAVQSSARKERRLRAAGWPDS